MGHVGLFYLKKIEVDDEEEARYRYISLHIAYLKKVEVDDEEEVKVNVTICNDMYRYE